MSDSSSRSTSPDPAVDRPYIATRRHRYIQNEMKTLDNQSTNFYSLDIFEWKDDDLAFRCAAAQSRLVYDEISSLEAQYFSHLLKHTPSVQLYLYCRNKILVLWHTDPIAELTFEDVLKGIPPPFDSDKLLIKNIHAFLQRYGYINYGVFMCVTRSVVPVRPKVLIIGAGVSGLAAARQLKFFGFDVKIIEARPRIGGRVFTHKYKNMPMNLGAQIITGLVGNPIVTLAKQLPVNLDRINNRCPIYDVNGRLVDSRKDMLIQRSFNKILEACTFLAHKMNVTEIDGRLLSLGKAISSIIDQQELRVLEKRLNYFKKAREVADILHEMNKRLLLKKMIIESCMSELRTLIDVDTATTEEVFLRYNDVYEADFEIGLRTRMLRSQLLSATEDYKETERQRKEYVRAFSEFKRMEPSQVYMNLTDKRILDFHLANLEYGIGAPVNCSSLKHWDHDDDYEFDGSHVTVNEGYFELIRHLVRGINLELDCVVKNVKYTHNGAEVTYYKKRTAWAPPPSSEQYYDSESIVDYDTVTEQADAVLCTVPLGVLKNCLAKPNAEASIKFSPPLPQWKKRAIMNLGFGSLNKIVLVFEKRFWDSELHTFGRLNEVNIARGEFFLFFTDGERPIITGLMSGESSTIMADIPEDQLVSRAMNILQNIFGSACPYQPLSHVITLWHTDPFSLGCYSYVSTKSTSQEYDLLAKPVSVSDDVNPRLFFAGEHTNRQYTATVHGAFLSGTRAAAEIADIFLGPPVTSTTKANPA